MPSNSAIFLLHFIYTVDLTSRTCAAFHFCIMIFSSSDGNMFSALHIASSKGHLSIVEILVAFDKSIIDWKNKYGRTALLTAASTCKTDIVKFLLDNNAAITEDYEIFNCLDWSIIRNDKQSAMVMMNHDRWIEVRKWFAMMMAEPAFSNCLGIVEDVTLCSVLRLEINYAGNILNGQFLPVYIKYCLEYGRPTSPQKLQPIMAEFKISNSAMFGCTFSVTQVEFPYMYIQFSGYT